MLPSFSESPKPYTVPIRTPRSRSAGHTARMPSNLVIPGTVTSYRPSPMLHTEQRSVIAGAIVVRRSICSLSNTTLPTSIPASTPRSSSMPTRSENSPNVSNRENTPGQASTTPRLELSKYAGTRACSQHETSSSTTSEGIPTSRTTSPSSSTCPPANVTMPANGNVLSAGGTLHSGRPVQSTARFPRATKFSSASRTASVGAASISASPSFAHVSVPSISKKARAGVASSRRMRPDESSVIVISAGRRCARTRRTFFPSLCSKNRSASVRERPPRTLRATSRSRSIASSASTNIERSHSSARSRHGLSSSNK